jgi:hypothetical protein
MRRKVIVMLMTLVGCASVASAVASAALAAPNPSHASCQAILTTPDAHSQIRDDVAREFPAAGFPPGEIYGLVARAKGATEEDCLASVGL